MQYVSSVTLMRRPKLCIHRLTCAYYSLEAQTFPRCSKCRSIMTSKEMCSLGLDISRGEGISEEQGRSNDKPGRSCKLIVLCFYRGQTRKDKFLQGVAHRHHLKRIK